MKFDSADLYDLENYLNLNNISKEDICLVGSTTLSLIGIRVHNDIDIVVHSKYKFKLPKHQFIERVNTPWSSLFLDDTLIENNDLHILYNGFKFVVPELVYHKKSWHNREKDQTDIIELNEYARMHKEWNWKLIEDSLPNPSFIKKILKKVLNRFYLHDNRLRDYFRNDCCLHKDAFQMLPTAILLAKQVVNNTFYRYDLIVRFMAIDAFLNNKREGIELYNKMQVKRGGSDHKNPWKIFKELIISFKNKGADRGYPILVNSDLHIVDGAHRLACALYFNEKYVPIKINKKLGFSPYGIDWFKNQDFSNEELKIIHQKKNEIFRINFLYFEVILWPPVSDHFSEIESEINSQFSVLESITYNDVKNFERFVRELYEIDDIKYWKVDLKIKGMSSYMKDIRVLKIEIPNPDFRRKGNNQLISKEVERLKKEIREKYKSKIDNYFHDIIIHIGDNYSHTKQSQNLLK